MLRVISAQQLGNIKHGRLFYNNNKKMLDQSDPSMNGRCYKPYAILEGLNKINDGDFLIYNDVSPELWNFIDTNKKVLKDKYSLSVIKKITLQNNNIITAYVNTELPNHNENYHRYEFYTLNRCMKKMGLEKFKYSLQHASGMFCIRKTKQTIEFVKEWLYYNLIDECASLGFMGSDKFEFWTEEAESREEKSTNKIGHRHDQSISGLLINKMDNKVVVPVNNFYPMYNFLTYCLINNPYTFENTNLVKTKLIYNCIFNKNSDKYESTLVSRI
jgi:hypothetical protein